MNQKQFINDELITLLQKEKNAKQQRDLIQKAQELQERDLKIQKKKLDSEHQKCKTR